jgi:hypothetical protein
MVRSQALVILGYFITLLKAQANIIQPIGPKISWTNTGIDPPNIIIFFQTDFVTVGTLTDFWVKISLPFLAYKMNSQWSSIPPGQCGLDSLVYQPCYEERYEADEIWTTFYVQLKGATYVPKTTYSLKFSPDRYLDFTGFSDSIRIAFVSKNVDGHIVYAYNNAFNCLYGTDVPALDLIVNDATEDPLRFSLNKIIDSYVILQIKGGIAERLLFKTTGDYTFADDAEIKCTTVEDPKSNILEISRSDYKCNFFKEIGGSNKNFLAYIWNNGTVPGGTYKFKFTLKTPTFGGTHSLSVFTMDRYGSRVHSMATMTDLFKTVPSAWAPGFPKLIYSFGISGTDDTLPQGIGLYSTTKGFNVIMNSLVFTLKSFEEIPPIPAGDSFTIELQLGTTQAVCPLGSVYHDFNVAPSKSEVIVTYSLGRLKFENVWVFNGKIYKISLKAGYPDATTLPNDADTGFGYISLIYGTYTIFKSQVDIRKGFTKINDNKPLLTNDWIISKDPRLPPPVLTPTEILRRHRGMAAIRSDQEPVTYTSAYAEIVPSMNGLLKGDGQNLILQTSVGPNFIYYASTLDPEHDSSKTFFQMITHNSITSKTSSWDDSFRDQNCNYYSPESLTWWPQDMPSTLIDTYIQNKYPNWKLTSGPAPVAPIPGYDFLGGCSFAQIQAEKIRYSRFRFRFQDIQVTVEPVLPPISYETRMVRGVEMLLYNTAKLNTPNGKQGTTYIWKNIDIRSFPSQINFGEADSVVLDLYFQVFFFATDAITDLELNASPSISVMENLYVLGNSDSIFPVASNFFSPHNVYENWNNVALPTGLRLTLNMGDTFPNVMHWSGTYNSIPDSTFMIKVYFDLIEPITISSTSKEVACAVTGLQVSKCEFEAGIPNVLYNQYKDIANNNAKAYAYNSRLAHALIMYVVPPTTLTGKFSVVFPYRSVLSNEIDDMNYDYQNKLVMQPSIMLVDNTYAPINIIDYGRGFDYQVWNLNSVYTVLPAAVTEPSPNTLDNVPADNNSPANSVWIDIPSTAGVAMVGAIPSVAGTISLKTNCGGTTCTPFAGGTNAYTFSTATFCGRWNFYSDPAFAINNSPLAAEANQMDCKKFRYYYNADLYGGTSTDIFCVYCPGLSNTATPTNDASAFAFPFTNFKLPNTRGLLWPLNTVAVLSHQLLAKVVPITGLSRTMSPNVVTLVSTLINLKQTFKSLKLDFSFTTTNPLPYGSSVFLQKVSGDLLLSVLGKSQNPPCTVRQNFVNAYRCVFSVLLSGIQIVVLDYVPAGKLDFELYGLSVGTVIGPNSVSFTVSTYLDQAMTPTLLVDSTPTGQILKFIWDPAQSSGSLTVSSLTSNIYQSLAYADVTFVLTLADRDFLITDFVSVNLGAAAIMDDSSKVLCLLYDNLGNTLETIALCNVESLSNIVIQFSADSTVKVLIVKLIGILMPQYPNPGVQATYKFNGDYTAFKSNIVPWSGLANFPVFTVTPVATFDLDARGQRADLLVTITPNSNIEIFRVFYLKFSTDFLPTISMYSFNVFEEKSGMMLQSWIAGPGMLAVTGWLFSIEGKLPYTIRIVGIEVPAILGPRQLQIIVADETGLITILQWGLCTIFDAPSMQGAYLIFIDSVRYDQRLIRINTGMEVDLIFTETAPKYIYMRVFFDYLSNEIYKTFNPTCSLVEIGTSKNLITTCRAYATKIEFYLTDDLVAGKKYTLRINDVLNPDYGYCEPIPPRIIVSNAMKSKTVYVSSNFVDNFLKVPFISEAGIKMLNFVSIPNGYVEVWRGFYATVDIGPVATTPGERTYFTDKVSFVLSYDLDGLFASDVIYYLGINSFQSQIGQSRAKFIIGANKNTVLTDYILYILRSETYKRQYTSLPLLKVRIVPNKATLLTTPKIIVYKGAGSLPISISPEKVPTLDTTFTVKFLQSYTVGLAIKDDVTDFTLGVTSPVVFLVITADTSTTLTTADLLLTRKDSTSPFIDKSIPIEIQSIPAGATSTDPVIMINSRLVTQFGATLDFGSTQVLYILFYVSPAYEFKMYTKSTLEAWVKRGITSIGDTKVGYAIIDNTMTLSTTVYDDLLAETTYKVRVICSSPLRSSAWTKEQVYSFDTLPRNLINGVINLSFKEPLFTPRKMWLLCLISIQYAIPAEDLWTDDGINCEPGNIAPFVMNWHTKKEGAINDTLAQLKDKADESILNPLKNLTVMTFSSRRQYQPSDTFDLLFARTRQDSTQTDWQSFIGDTGTINTMGNLIKLYITDTPVIQGQLKTQVSATNASYVVANGVSLSTDGYLLAVYGRKELFGDTPSISDIKDVTTFSGYFYDFYKANQPVELTMKENLVPKADFAIFMVAFNNDPRKNAKTSTIQGVTFVVPSPAVQALSLILSVASALLLGLTYL